MKIQCVFAIAIITLWSSCAGSPPSGHHRASGFFQEKILIQSSEGLYIRLEINAQEPRLVADAKNIADADTFNFCDLDNNIGALQAMNGLYVSIHLEQENQAMVRQEGISYWEKIFIIKKSENLVFQGINHKYILPNKENDLVLTAMSESSENPLCHFKIIPIP